MARVALWNIFVGFVVVFISASAGAFIAQDITQNVISGTDGINTWFAILSRSAHGHFNLFGFLHILMGLSLSYSLLSEKSKILQSVFLSMGTLAMGPVLLIKAYTEPTRELDALSYMIGAMLSLALLSIAMHIYGLGLKIIKRA